MSRCLLRRSFFSAAFLGRRIAFIVGAFTGVMSLSTYSQAAPPSNNRAAAELVKQALQDEAQGLPEDRQQALQSALQQAPQSPQALWQNGYVRFENKWVKYDDVPSQAAKTRSLIAYRQVRSQYPDTVDGQLQLADWCAKKNLADEERAHLTRVLELQPDHAAARQRLGFQRVDGVWISKEEVQSSRAKADQLSAGLKKWSPRIEKIRSVFASPSANARQSAAERLQAIDDPAAIPSMEAVLATYSEDAALAVVDALARQPNPEASLALARQGVFSKWNSVRDAAAKHLKDRQRDDYVPALLSAMYTPLRSKAEVYAGPGGRLMYTHVFLREGQDRKELNVLTTAFRPEIGADARTTLAMTLQATNAVAASREKAMMDQNTQTIDLNERISWVLSLATSSSLSSTPDGWWQWWNDQNEVSTGDKPVSTTYHFTDLVVTDGSSSPTTMDCLAAGTPVWTEAGPVAIDKIKLGDRVLSQDPQSGELAYKPVLRTTIRPPSTLVKIQTGETTVEASGGHPFWSSGDGWLKARQIKTGLRLHTVNGPALVDQVEPSIVAPTYNLVVADFHTYFVGTAKILSHDNTVRQATTAIVPGLSVR